MIVLGIDLGTTNSCCYAYVDGDIDIVETKNGNRTLPSVITFDDEEIIVGEFAYQNIIKKDPNTIYAVKRLIGMSYAEYKKDYEGLLHYTVVDNDGMCAIKVNNKIYSPEEISSFILKEIKENATLKYNQEVNDVVITVPAYFNNEQRKATRKAGELAGFNVMKIINEPTAASISYTDKMENDEEQKALIFDLGGGTFDISLVYIEKNGVEVIASGGNNFLGGEDFDNLIMFWVARELNIMNKIRSNELEKSKLLKECETAKKMLSLKEKTKITYEDQSIEITRDKMENLIKGRINDTFNEIIHLLEEQKLKYEDIDYIILVGGSTKLPYLRQEVQKKFKNVLNNISVDEVVAKGALTHAMSLVLKKNKTEEGKVDKTLQEKTKTVTLVDVTPFDLGLEIENDGFAPIITKNSKIPIKKKQIFKTTSDNQEHIELVIFQGNNSYASENHKIGETEIKNIPQKSAGEVKITVEFYINSDGILKITAIIDNTDIVKELDLKI